MHAIRIIPTVLTRQIYKGEDRFYILYLPGWTLEGPDSFVDCISGNVGLWIQVEIEQLVIEKIMSGAT